MAYDYSTIANMLGVNVFLFVVIMLWSLAWKLAALWKSARKGSLIWFVILGVVNTVGILEILYIFVFSEMNLDSKKKLTSKKKVKRKLKKK